MGREGVRTHPCGMDVLRGCIFPSCRVVSRCVTLCRVRRCSLREPPAAKHSSTSLRLSGRAGVLPVGVLLCSVLSCRVALRCVLSCRVALRCVRRCSLWEPPAVKHGSTSLRLSGRAGDASGGCSSPFCLVLPCRVALRPVLSRCVALRPVASRCVRRCSLWEPPAAKHGSTSLRLSGRTGALPVGVLLRSVLFCLGMLLITSNNF